MISSLHDSDTAKRCLELVERHGPRLMKTGGGALATEIKDGRGNRATAAERSKCCEQYERTVSVKLTAQICARSEDWVRRVLNENGYPLRAPGGRKKFWVGQGVDPERKTYDY